MSAQLENGYTQIANEILEELSKTYLSPYEWQVLMCIFRKTYGYKKKADYIAISQMTEMTNIHKAHISRTLKKLKDRQIVTQIGNSIGFNKATSSWLPKQVTIKKLPKQVTAVTQMGNKKLPKQADTKERKKLIQKKAPQTSKNSLTACTEKELKHLSEIKKVEIETVKRIHQTIMDKIADGIFQQKKYGKTVYFTLSNWIEIYKSKPENQSQITYRRM